MVVGKVLINGTGSRVRVSLCASDWFRFVLPVKA